MNGFGVTGAGGRGPEAGQLSGRRARAALDARSTLLAVPPRWSCWRSSSSRCEIVADPARVEAAQRARRSRRAPPTPSDHADAVDPAPRSPGLRRGRPRCGRPAAEPPRATSGDATSSRADETSSSASDREQRAHSAERRRDERQRREARPLGAATGRRGDGRPRSVPGGGIRRRRRRPAPARLRAAPARASNRGAAPARRRGLRAAASRRACLGSSRGPASELGLDPVHHRAQLLALALDLVVRPAPRACAGSSPGRRGSRRSTRARTSPDWISPRIVLHRLARLRRR